MFLFVFSLLVLPKEKQEYPCNKGGGGFVICCVVFINDLFFLQVCDICEEPFEEFWEEDLEEWHFKDAVRTEDSKVSRRGERN